MDRPLKIVFCASEVVPFAKTGGMADVCGSLPLALERLGLELLIVMPRYRGVERVGPRLSAMNNRVSATRIGDGVEVLFIDKEGFFDRDGLYGDEQGDYPDNLDRFQYFSRQTLEVLRQLNICPDILHCHDWQTALIPAYLKTVLKADPFFRDVKTMFSIHNLAYQGLFPKGEFPKLGLGKAEFKHSPFEFYDQISLLKAGLEYSDVVATVSPNYAREILTPEFGCGLEGVLQARPNAVIGILNGIDETAWNPRIDPLIPATYSVDDLTGKARDKAALQACCGLPQRADVPVFGSVGRLSHQKGIDLLAEAAERMAQMGAQIVILGTGEERYHQLLRDVAARYPQSLAINLDFNEPLAHQIYAGSDFFLMPSVYEPCGLSQLISLRYGTIPVVSRTGGLVDTVTPAAEGGNGFLLAEHTVEALVAAVREAMSFYQDQAAFQDLVRKACSQDFSWEESARKYSVAYQNMLSR